VVGIVCSRLVERFGRPAILLQQNDELCKGSARSIDGYSITEGIAAGAEFLTTAGGHAMAAGLSLVPQHLDAFTSAVVKHANEHIHCEDLVPSITLDCDATLAELDADAVHWLHALSPFGRCNRSPLILLRDVALAEAPKQIGAQGKHLSLNLRQDIAGTGRRFIRAVWWNAGDRASDFAAGMRLDLAIEPKLNEWNGRVNVEAHLKDARACVSPALTT
jgi:single-stranded-DNA-specific exonuclease